ncbi:MAG: hypothetical protein LBT38_07080 [Deltaproteobacteria bacterium]|jgi:hypothetical protein|nr:hypothetical protein [Deltaproteobacteria bacterium]
MFSLICPNCQKKLKTKEGSQPRADDWIRCPACQELFHPQLMDDLDFLAAPAPDSSLSPSFPSQSLVRTLSHGISKSLALIGLAADMPGTASRANFTALWKALIWGLATATVLFVFGLMFFLAEPEPIPETPPRPTIQAPDYATTFLPGDLKSLRANLNLTRLAYKKIDYRGYESRIYNYFAEKAGDDYCQDIASLTINSDNTSQGFRVVGVCVDEKSPTPELLVDWRSVNQIRVSIIEKQGPKLLEIVELNGKNK